ncbi:CDK5 regulatory subunit-associated protein 3, partial [Cuculus canorus]
DNVRQELLALVKDLPSLLSEIAAGAGALSEAIELYQACVEFVCESSAELVVPLLRHVGKRGNTTVYEWRTGLQPLRVERPAAEEVPEPPKEDTVRTSWSPRTLAAHGGSPKRCRGGRLSTVCGTGWGGGTTSVSELWRSLPCSPPARPAVPEGVACGSEALTLLENTETRNQFIDELMELELFLSQRLAEMEEEADIVAVSQFQLAPAALQGQSSARLGSLLGSARALLGQLCTRSMQHLFMILASPR